MSLLKAVLTKKSESTEDADTVPEINRPKSLLPARVYLTRLDSFSSLSSIYSADGGQADYSISGSILLGIWHKNDTLFVRVAKAKNLAGAKAGGLSDPYVKTYLLPDHSKLTKRKTTIQRKTNDPTYNETLKTKLPRSELAMRTLWLSMWDWDRYGRNLFLGELHLNLTSVNLTNPADHWYKLREKKHGNEIETRGKIVFSVMYSPYSSQKKGSLFIKVKEATGLLQMNPQGLTDSAVRIFLLPKRSPFTKKKTKCVHNTLDPVWNEEFEYKYVTLDDLASSRVLELSVWDYDRRGCNDFIGCVRLGPTPDETNEIYKDWMDSTEAEVSHWTDILAHPGEWMEACHDLRPSIASRFSEYPSVQDESDVSAESDEGDESESDEEDDDDYGSKLSLYSECETRGEYPITGRLRVKLEYKKGILRVHTLSAADLAAADSNGFSDPYVKMYLLPDKSKHSKRKTDVKLKTLNPVFNETMQYEVGDSKLSSHTLWFSVWDWDKFGKNEFLGEVKVPFTETNVNGPAQWYSLSDSVDVGKKDSPKTASGVGKLTIALKFEQLGSKNGEMYGKLHIHIRNAIGLPNMDTQGYTDGFVKLFLLPTKTSKTQRKTKVIKDDLNPTWNEIFVYNKVTVEQLSSEHALEVTVWDHDMISSNDFVGGLRIGPAPKPDQTKEWMDSTKHEAAHWEEMLSCPGEWVERCHVLRSSMEYRDVSIPEPLVVSKVPAKEMVTSHSKPTMSTENQVEEMKSPNRAHQDSLALPGHTMEEEPAFLHRGSMVMTNRPKRSPSPRMRAKRLGLLNSDGINTDTEIKAESNELKVARNESEVAQDESKVAQDESKVAQDESKHVQVGTIVEQEESNIAQDESNIAQDESKLSHDDRPRVTQDEDAEDKPTSTIKNELEASYNSDEEFRELVQESLQTSISSNPTEKLLASEESHAESKDGQENIGTTSKVGEKEEHTCSQLVVSLKFEVTSKKRKTKGNLHVKVKEALQLQCKTEDGIFAKCRMLPHRIFSNKKKTKVIKNTANPVWDQLYMFDKQFQDELAHERVLEITLWDNNDGSKLIFVGGLHLGPSATAHSRRNVWMDSTNEEVKHWEAMFTNPGEWVEVTHTLRPTINY